MLQIPKIPIALISRRTGLILGGVVLTILLAVGISRLVNKKKTENAQKTPSVDIKGGGKAELTQAKYERDSVRALLNAAKQLNGELIAALRIRIAQRETVFIHQTIETRMLPGGTRTATFADSTTWAWVKGKVTAPADTGQPLSVQYTLGRKAFTPQIGVVKTGDAYFAVVQWEGERIQLDKPFFRAPQPPRVTPYVRGAWSPQGAVLGSAGMEFRVGRFAPYVEAMGMATSTKVDSRLWVGTGYKF